MKTLETEAFMRRAFMDGYVTETGTGIARILPPSNPFLPESGIRKQTVIEKLKEYLRKFLGTTEESYTVVKMYPTYEEGDGLLMAAEGND